MKSVLIGTCDYCGGEVYENSIDTQGGDGYRTLKENWCESERIIIDDIDVVIPVSDAPEDLHDNDPEAYGEFVEEKSQLGIMRLTLERC